MKTLIIPDFAQIGPIVKEFWLLSFMNLLFKFLTLGPIRAFTYFTKELRERKPELI